MGTAASSSSTGCGYLEAIRRRLYLRNLDKVDAMIDRQTARAIRCLEAEEEQSQRARYWMGMALKRPTAEGRSYTRTDLLTYRSLQRKLTTHQVKIQGHIKDLDNFAAMRITNDKLRMMANGGNHRMAEIVDMQAKLNSNPLQTARKVHQRDTKTAARITEQHEAAKMATEASQAIQHATEDIHNDLEVELDDTAVDVDELDGVDLERHMHTMTSLAAIERKFTDGLLDTLPAAPTRALLSPPRSTVSSPGTRSKKQAGKQYAELEEHKEEMEL